MGFTEVFPRKKPLQEIPAGAFGCYIASLAIIFSN
jgi:hypothetical protein